MAYAAIQDLIDRFGATELIRLTTPSDQDMDGIVQTVAETALEIVNNALKLAISKQKHLLVLFGQIFPRNRSGDAVPLRHTR